MFNNVEIKGEGKGERRRGRETKGSKGEGYMKRGKGMGGIKEGIEKDKEKQ